MLTTLFDNSDDSSDFEGFCFVPEDNHKINSKNNNPNKLIIAKKSKWLIKNQNDWPVILIFGSD